MDDLDLTVAAHRCLRQREELARLIDAARLQRAADLAHEHLAEFADDHLARGFIVRALAASHDDQVRRRADEFTDLTNQAGRAAVRGAPTPTGAARSDG